jgi:hypothetical protein
MSVTLTVNYKEIFNSEIVTLIDELVEDNYALDDILEFIDENGGDNFQTYYVDYCEQGENLGYEVVDVFVKEYGFADVEHCGDAFVGYYADGASFAEEYLSEIMDVPDCIVVDWDATWERSLAYDYDFIEGDGFRAGYVFRRYY